MRAEAEGIEYAPVSFTVDPERVAAFAEVFGLGSGVPPTFLTVAEFAVFATMIADPRLGLDFAHVVHGTQEYEFGRPLREGEDLEVHARIESAKVRGGVGFLTVAMQIREPGGPLVATARSTMVERAAL